MYPLSTSGIVSSKPDEMKIARVRISRYLQTTSLARRRSFEHLRRRLANYRPISVLSLSFSKFLEGVVYNCLVNYLHTLDILSKNQMNIAIEKVTPLPKH